MLREEARLRISVAFHAPVAVEMIGGESEQHAGPGREGVDAFQLERRDLEDREIKGRADQVEGRYAKVACRPCRSPAALAIASINLTTVDLPFVPVTARIGIRRARKQSSMSPRTGGRQPA